MEQHEELFEKAYNDYADAIFRHCAFRLMDRERGKDLMQETFLRMWNFIEDGKEVENMRAFLYRIANNLIVDDVRKRKTVSLEQLQEAGWDPGGDDGVITAQDHLELGRVLDILKDLDATHRQVIVLRYIDGLNPADIAEILGESANTISVRLHRAIKHAKALLQAPHRENLGKNPDSSPSPSVDLSH
jgi:RNA polymerase sigma-70 factor (ECF subfamily)